MRAAALLLLAACSKDPPAPPVATEDVAVVEVPFPQGMDAAPDGMLQILESPSDAGLVLAEAGLSFSLKDLKGGPVYHEPVEDAGKRLKETISVSGRLAQDVVKKVLHPKLGPMKSCVVKPGSSAKIRFVIDAAGRVTSIEHADAKERACLEGVLKPLQFPAPEGGVAVVTYAVTYE
jgi:hypothetical protein